MVESPKDPEPGDSSAQCGPAPPSVGSQGLAQTAAREGGAARRRIRWWLWVALVALAGLGCSLLLSLLGRGWKSAGAGERGAASPPPVPVLATPATRGDINVYLSGLGSVTPLYTVTIRTRVDGELQSVAFEEGQIVAQGQLLAQIDPRPFRAQLELAEGQMARDLASLENAKLDLARYATLAEQDSIARQQLDTQSALVRQLEGTVTADRGNVDNARLQLEYASITAPIGGRVGLRLVDPGNIVHASDANGLVVLTRLQPIAVLFAIAEDSLPAVLANQRAGESMQVDAQNRELTRVIASGRLLTTDNQIDPATGTVRLKAIFDNEDSALFPGQFVNARLLLRTEKDRTVVPAAAVQRGAQATFVYVLNADSTVSVRNVTVGPAEGNRVAIESGLSAGEQVVTDGVDRLRDGSKVVLRGEGEGASGNTPGSAPGAASPGGGGPAGIPRSGAGSTP